MAPCTDCQASRETSGLWRQFNPACVYCGARLIRQLASLPIAPEEVTKRRKAALELWLAHGHSEEQIRELKAGPLALEPVPDAQSRPKGRTGASSKSNAAAALT
jgi:hypothetical protein